MVFEVKGSRSISGTLGSLLGLLFSASAEILILFAMLLHIHVGNVVYLFGIFEAFSLSSRDKILPPVGNPPMESRKNFSTAALHCLIV